MMTTTVCTFTTCYLCSVDRKNCENVIGKPEDQAYNAASFIWTPELGAKVSSLSHVQYNYYARYASRAISL